MFEKAKILLLSNLANKVTEDQELARFLRASFDVDHEDCQRVIVAPESLAQYNLILLRNLWPFEVSEKALQELTARVRSLNIPTYNPLRKGGIVNKNYLVFLTQLGFATIPTYLDKRDLPNSGTIKDFVIKPIVGGYGSQGVRKLTKAELLATDCTHFIVQPFIDFEHEVSFFFVDGNFSYALRTKAKVDLNYEASRWNLEVWSPTSQQVLWAKRFINWNARPYGVERIDAGIQSDGTLLLMEIEDFAPYFSLEILPVDTKEHFLNRLTLSLRRVIDSASSQEGG